MSDGKKYTRGSRFPRETHRVGFNGQKQLTDESAYLIRKMIMAFDLSMSKFNGLLNIMAVYFLGRPLELEEFSRPLPFASG